MIEFHDRKLIAKAVRSHISFLRESISELKSPVFTARSNYWRTTQKVISEHYKEINVFKNLLEKINKSYGLDQTDNHDNL